jgi:GTP cyclohydrolase II
MLLALGLRKIRLLTNNPDKVAQLRRWGIDVVAVEPTLVSVNEHNRRYLTAKRDLASHSLALSPDAARGERP